MRRLVKGIICLIAALGLVACSANSPKAPEWKRVYFQLMKDTFNEDINPRGVEDHYGIELYDLDSNGIPELFERYPRATQPDYRKIWFIDDGMARPLLFRYPQSLEWEDIEFATGIYINHETGDMLAERIYSHHQFESYEYFAPSESVKIWSFVAAVGFADPYPDSPAEYDHIDSEGIRREISEPEYKEYAEQILIGYSLLKEDFLNLAPYFPWSDESAKITSDYFDSYDGIQSMVYMQS